MGCHAGQGSFVPELVDSSLSGYGACAAYLCIANDDVEELWDGQCSDGSGLHRECGDVCRDALSSIGLSVRRDGVLC